MKQKFLMPTGELAERDMPQWKTPWNHDRDFESERTATYTPEPSLTKQEFVEETNINTILERFTRSGEPPPLVLPEHFADLTTATTHFEMASRVASAQALFYKLPASMRAEFLNDPTRWADAVVDAVENNDRDYLEELGIDVPKEKPLKAVATPEPGNTPVPDPQRSSAPGASNAPQGGADGDKPPKPPTDSAKK